MNKMIAPLFIVIICIVVICAYTFLILSTAMGLLLKIFIGVALIGLTGALIYVLIQRIKEIWEEDEDDFSKY